MANRRKLRLLVVVFALSAGTVCQYLPSGCTEYYTYGVASAFNWCSVFNCAGGEYFNMCRPNPLFLDCPSAVTTQ
ncbi:MAG: hypothetical protein AB1716_08375 [Planctomycetota bacterium]